MQASPAGTPQKALPPYIRPPIPLSFCGYLGHKIYKKFSTNKWGAFIFIFKSILTSGVCAAFKTYNLRQKFLRDRNRLNHFEKNGIKEKDITIQFDSGKNVIVKYRAAGRIRFNSLGDVYISLPEKTHASFFKNVTFGEISEKEIKAIPRDLRGILLMTHAEIEEKGEEAKKKIQALQDHIVYFNFPQSVDNLEEKHQQKRWYRIIISKEPALTWLRDHLDLNKNPRVHFNPGSSHSPEDLKPYQTKKPNAFRYYLGYSEVSKD